MNVPAPRYEFRLFSQDIGEIEALIRSKSDCIEKRHSEEVYLLQPHVYDRNIKIRNGRLEIKQLIARHQGLEQWSPTGQWDLPISLELLKETIFPGCHFEQPSQMPTSLSIIQLLEIVSHAQPRIFSAKVSKQRSLFAINQCRAEIVEFKVNGASIRSVAIESEDPDALCATRSLLHLENRENINYPLALSRILGLSSRPKER